MLGLEYILNLYNMQYIELAEKLGIKKQNINMWIKGKQKIPKKYYPTLEELFGVKAEYFGKEINEIDKLEIQKEKLKGELKPVITKYEEQFSLNDPDNLKKVPIYDNEEINAMDKAIDKTKVMSKLYDAINVVEDNPYMDTYKLLAEIMEKAQHEALVHKTIEALAHYFEVLPDYISSNDGQEEFEGELFEVFDDYNY
ncbi:MAG: helix-turn-helix domain-containing protein [Clostridium sp.]